ncbi:hypothetical protein [Helicobacter pylori]|uniref:hypothetical protein n=1 Tax=Helicobacter pylori TaxID=210 RepID=UPI0013E351C6|nr:hypothetical protein [Helicobacter pylori]
MSNHHNNKKEENTNKAQITPPNNSNDAEPLKVTTRYLEVKNYKNIGLEKNIFIEDLDSFDLDNKPKQQIEFKAFKLF